MLQGSLFGCGPAALAPGAPWRREFLDECCWVDRCATLVLGADDLLAELVAAVPLQHRRRLMYGAWVDEPRLSGPLDPRAVPIVSELSRALSVRYRDHLGACWVNYYRDGADSVAWHGDRIGDSAVDPLVAIVSLGGPRRLALRPKGKGKSTSYVLHSGDALVMGGACQHHFEHAIPKTAHAPPRMSLTFRNPAKFQPPE